MEVTSSTDKLAWQQNLERSAYSTVSQTYQWSQAYLEALRDIPLFLTVRDRTDTVVAQLLLFVINEYERRLSPPYNRALRFLPSRLGTGTKLIWSYGPVIHDMSRAKTVLKLILEEVDELAREWNVTQIYGTTPPLVDHTDEYRDPYARSSYRIVDWGTFIVDATRDVNTIWGSLDNKFTITTTRSDYTTTTATVGTTTTRNDIKRAADKMIVREVTDDDLLLKFASLSLRFNEAKRGRPNEESAIRYYKIFWNNLHYSKRTLSPISKLFIAFQDKEPRAGLMLNSFSGNVTQHNVVSDGSKGNLGGTLLTWHAIGWAHSCGFKTLDLTGVNPNPSSPEERGIYSYKSKWSGSFRTQYNLIKVLKPFKTKAFAVYVMVQKRLWNLQGISP